MNIRINFCNGDSVIYENFDRLEVFTCQGNEIDYYQVFLKGQTLPMEWRVYTVESVSVVSAQ